MIFNDDCLSVLNKMESNSVDALITDPPAGISFMGKGWDSDKGGRDGWIAWMQEIMMEVFRVLKPGAHGLVWALPRTSHWTATALEDAGFEVRDVITHLFGSGFPKSLDISKAIDKATGVEREIGTDEAKQWAGWGTALKPASEHWILIRKPISEKTIAANVLKWGTGGINIEKCRIEYQTKEDLEYSNAGAHRRVKSENENNTGGWKNTSKIKIVGEDLPKGRFPANLVLDEEAAKMLDEQVKGKLHAAGNKNLAKMNDGSGMFGSGQAFEAELNYRDFDGGASRFFYVAKASKKDRNEGLEGMPLHEVYVGHVSPTPMRDERQQSYRQNHHPTVKSTKLMEYLITLITPPTGIVLDPFMGSGSTGVAANRLGFKFIGIEKEKEYFEIAERRIL